MIDQKQSANAQRTANPQGKPAKPKRPVVTAVKWAVLVIAAAVFIAAGAGALWMNDTMSARYEPDLTTLVPAEMAIVVEARDLDSARDDLAEFVQTLIDDPAVHAAAQTQRVQEMLDDDPSTVVMPRDLIGQVESQLGSVRIPVADDLFGRIDIASDLLGAEAIVAVRGEPGVMPRQEQLVQPIGAAPGVIQMSDVIFAEKQVLALTRVSGKIKLYLQFDTYALDRQTQLRDGFSYVIEPNGARRVTAISPATGKSNTGWYALVGDVLAVATAASLMDDVLRLSRQAGSRGSLAKSDAYADAVTQLLADIAADGIDHTEIVADPTVRDLKRATRSLERWPLLITVNADEARRIANIDGFIGVPDEFKRAQGNDVYLFVDDAIGAVVASPAIRTIACVIGPDALSLTLEGRAAVIYHRDRLPVHIAELNLTPPAKSGINALVPDRAMAIVTLGADPDVLSFHFRVCDARRGIATGGGAGLSTTFFNAVKPYVAGDVGVIVAPQEVRPNTPVMPVWAVTARVSPEGQVMELEEVGSLAEAVFRGIVSNEAVGPGGAAPTVPESFEFPRFPIGNSRTIVGIQQRDNQGNVIPFTGTLRQFFGDEVNPACCLIDDTLVFSTSLEFLESIVEAFDARVQRFRPVGGAFTTPLSPTDPVNAQFVLDAGAALEEFWNESNIRTLANQIYPTDQILDPNVPRQLRAQAIADSNGDKQAEDARYQELKQDYLRKQAVLSHQYVTAKLDARRSLLVLRRITVATAPCADSQTGQLRADAFQLRFAIELGSEQR